jgi:hypothetical protein
MVACYCCVSNNFVYGCFDSYKLKRQQISVFSGTKYASQFELNLKCATNTNSIVTFNQKERIEISESWFLVYCLRQMLG